MQHLVRIGTQGHPGILADLDGFKILLRHQRRHPHRTQIGDGHYRLGGVIEHVAARDIQTGDTARHRRAHHETSGMAGVARAGTQRLHARPGPCGFGLCLGVIAARLVQVAVGNHADLGLLLLALEVFGCQCQCIDGLGVVIVSLTEIR